MIHNIEHKSAFFIVSILPFSMTKHHELPLALFESPHLATICDCQWVEYTFCCGFPVPCVSHVSIPSGQCEQHVHWIPYPSPDCICLICRSRCQHLWIVDQFDYKEHSVAIKPCDSSLLTFASQALLVIRVKHELPGLVHTHSSSTLTSGWGDNPILVTIFDDQPSLCQPSFTMITHHHPSLTFISHRHSTIVHLVG